jgi:hypothetical protein
MSPLFSFLTKDVVHLCGTQLSHSYSYILRFYKFTHVTLPSNVKHNDEKGNVQYLFVGIAKQLHKRNTISATTVHCFPIWPRPEDSKRVVYFNHYTFCRPFYFTGVGVSYGGLGTIVIFDMTFSTLCANMC